MTNVGTVVTPKFAVITASSSGNNSLVSAVSGKKIRVLALWLTANGTVNVKLYLLQHLILQVLLTLWSIRVLYYHLIQ